MATITGTSGNDNLNGTSGNDTLNGLGGNDTLIGSGGTDFYDGGTGTDTLDLSTAAAGVTVGFANGTISGGFNGTFVNIERVLGGIGGDSLMGASGNQRLESRGGNDTLAGGAGIDTLWGGGGADMFVFRETGTANADSVADFSSGSDKIVLDAAVMTALGASGNFAAGDARFVANSTGSAQDASDRIVFNTTTKQVFYDADGNGSGAAVLIATLQSGATLVASDVVVEGGGSGGAQTINGTSGNDSLVGGTGNDTINGFDGNDTIDGGAGADSMAGGQGDDTYFVDSSGDVVVEPLDGGFDTVNASVSYTLPAFVNHLTLTGSASINGTGNDAANVITGNSGNNSLLGAGGNDIFLMGGAATPGTDWIDGGDGIDTIDYSDARSALTADLSEAGIRGGGEGGTGSARVARVENLFAGAFDDSIIGDEAANRLEGRAGNDTLSGEGGTDTLAGGTGSDVFELQGPGTADFIADFASGGDKIQVNGRNLLNIGPSGNFSAADGRFWSAAGASSGHDADDRIIYDTSAGNLYYDADGSGSGAAQLIATLQAGAALTAADITVINGQDGGPDSPGTVTSFELSGNVEIDALLTPFLDKWGLGGEGTGASLTYSFRTEASRYSASEYGPGSEPYVDWEPLSEAQREAIRDALAAISDFADLEFTEVVDSDTVAGDLRFGNTAPIFDAGAWAYYPAATASAGDVWFTNGWETAPHDPGTSGYRVVMHEIGHALGLKHPFEGPITLPPEKDNYDYTVMAYSGSPWGPGSFQLTPMLLDVAALQYIYGANDATRTGNDVYSWAVGEPIYETLWDAGGIDSIDWSNQATRALINLNSGAWCEIGPERGSGPTTNRNLTIAYGCTIENATGGAAGDVLIGNGVGNALASGGGDDMLDGDGGNDTLAGGAGADSFVFDLAPDVANADRIDDFNSASDAIWLDASVMTGLGSLGFFSAADARFWSSTSGTAHDADDRVIYNTSTGQLWYDADGSGAGAAQLIAILQPGAALAAIDIHVIGPGGSQAINGTSGNDSLVGGSGNDTINGLAGNDTLSGVQGDDSLSGGDGDDSLLGGEGNDMLAGGNGSDTLDGGGERDTLEGGAGDDTYLNWGNISDSGGIDTLITTSATLPDGIENLTLRGDASWEPSGDGNALDNVIRNETSGYGVVFLAGYEGNDTIIGGDSLDYIYSSAGDDVVDGGAGPGEDALFVGSFSAVIGDFRNGTVTGGGVGGSASVSFTNIEALSGGSYDDVLISDDAGRSLVGASGNDTLTGGAGNDYLNADTGFVDHDSPDMGNDSLYGGAGDDFLKGGGDYDEGSRSDTLDGAAGNDTLLATSGSDVLVFSVAPGAGNADIVHDFNSGVDRIVLDGNAHANIGASGAFAGGDARFFAGPGANSGQDASDRVVYNTTTGQLWYDTDGNGSGSAQLIATLAGLPMLAATDISVVNGTTSGAVINGTSASDTLQGGAGNDTLNGLAGNDALVGSGGTDFYDGGTGSDTLDVRATMTGVAVSFASGTISGGFSGTFANIERVLGGNGADSLVGAAGGQNLSSRMGDDTLAGGAGVDTLWGGGGADTFVFREMGTTNADRISDFASASDKLHLDDAAFTAIGAMGNFAAGDGRFVANSNGTAQDAGDRVVFNISTGQLYYDADGSGSGGSQLIATVQSGATVGATDIVVI